VLWVNSRAFMNGLRRTSSGPCGSAEPAGRCGQAHGILLAALGVLAGAVAEPHAAVLDNVRHNI
jgi:hypothetical protein